MTMSTGATIINGSFEFPHRGWDILLNIYITLAIWIFMAGVGVHAHMRNHFRSGFLSYFIMIPGFLYLLWNFFRSEDNRVTVKYSYTRMCAFHDRHYANEGLEFLCGCVTFLFFGISVAGPLIEGELNILRHNPNGPGMILMGLILYNLNMFLCLSQSVMFQPAESFIKFLLPAAFIVFVVLILLLLISLVVPHNQLLILMRITDAVMLICVYGGVVMSMAGLIEELVKGWIQDYIPYLVFVFIYLLFLPQMFISMLTI